MIFYLQGFRLNWPGYGGIINSLFITSTFHIFRGNKNPESGCSELPGLKFNRATQASVIDWALDR
jgi:hypothetical protein